MQVQCECKQSPTKMSSAPPLWRQSGGAAAGAMRGFPSLQLHVNRLLAWVRRVQGHVRNGPLTCSAHNGMHGCAETAGASHFALLHSPAAPQRREGVKGTGKTGPRPCVRIRRRYDTQKHTQRHSHNSHTNSETETTTDTVRGKHT